MRQNILTPQADQAVVVDLDLTRDEPRRILITGTETVAQVMTISATEGGDPLIEITGTGRIDLLPDLVQLLREGHRYHYNVWDRRNPTALLLLAKGRITFANSIRPTGTLVPTLFLEGFGQPYGPQRIVICSGAEFGALASPDPSTIYVVR